MPSDVFGVGKVVETLVEPAVQLMMRIAGPAADEMGLALKDEVHIVRSRRAMKLGTKVLANIKRCGFDPKRVDLKMLLPILEFASVEEDDGLHSAWANLLTNAACPGSGTPVSPSFPHILRELTPRDAKFLDALHSEAERVIAKYPQVRGVAAVLFTFQQLLIVYSDASLSRLTVPHTFTQEEYERGAGRDLEAEIAEFALTFDVLRRHGLFRDDQKFGFASDIPGISAYGEMPAIESTTLYTLSTLAVAFVAACREPSPKNPKGS